MLEDSIALLDHLELFKGFDPRGADFQQVVQSMRAVGIHLIRQIVELKLSRTSRLRSRLHLRCRVIQLTVSVSLFSLRGFLLYSPRHHHRHPRRPIRSTPTPLDHLRTINPTRFVQLSSLCTQDLTEYRSNPIVLRVSLVGSSS